MGAKTKCLAVLHRVRSAGQPVAGGDLLARLAGKRETPTHPTRRGFRRISSRHPRAVLSALLAGGRIHRPRGFGLDMETNHPSRKIHAGIHPLPHGRRRKYFAGDLVYDKEIL